MNNKDRRNKLKEIRLLTSRVKQMKVSLIKEDMSVENFLLNYMRMKEAEVRLTLLKDETDFVDNKPITIIRKYARQPNEYVRTKFCGICGESKRTNQFNYLPSSDKYHTYCRPCLSAYNKMKYLRNK